MSRAASLLALVIGGACASTPASSDAGPCDEVTLVARTPAVFTTPADVTRFFTTAQAQHVTAVALAMKHDEDDVAMPSGRAFYASAIATVASGYEHFDVLAAAIDEAHARGIQVIAWVPQFHDATAIEHDASWSMGELDASHAIVPYVGPTGELFASPANAAVRAYERSIVVEIASRYAVDGIVLDWVRYDGWTTGMEDATRMPYLARYGVDPASIDFTQPSDERERWRAYRAEIVASHVRETRAAIDAVRPGLSLGVFILSPEWSELSQDASLFASAIDWVSPMAYFADWGLPPSWVWTDIVPATYAHVGPSVRIVPTLDEVWTDAQNAMVLDGLRTSTPYVRRVAWFAYGNWEDARIERLAPLRICR